MIQKFKVFLFTEDADKLVTFYTDLLGFKKISELKLPMDYGYMVEAAPGYEIWIANHSKVNGKSKDSYRICINFYTPDLDELYKKLQETPEITVITKLQSMKKWNPDSDRRVFTILDPDGNMLQFMEPRK